MENTITKKEHKVLDRPILSTILLIVFVSIVNIVFQAGQYMIWGAGSGGIGQYFYSFITVFLTLLVTELVYTKMWFKGEFEGTLKGDIGYGFKLMIPVIVVDVLIFIYDRIAGTGSMNSILFVLSISFTAGIIEEIMFRSLILSNLMRITKTYRGMIGAVTASALIFGTVHLQNLIMGANLGATISQFFSATCMGFFFAAVYLACGSVVPLMALHFGHDVLALLFLGINEAGATTQPETMTSTIENMIMNIVLIVMAVIILKPDNYEKIRKVWNEKWHLNGDV